MGFRFQKRINLMPGITLNFSKGGPSLSIGPRGAKLNISPRGLTEAFGLPGTGLSYSVFQSFNEKSGKRKTEPEQAIPEDTKQFHITFLKGIFLPPEDKKFAKAVNLLLDGNIDGALDGFEKIPGCPDADFTAAVLYLNREEYKAADAAISRALVNQYSIGELYLRYELHFHLSLPITDVFEVQIRPTPIAAALIKAETLQHTDRIREACDLLLKLHIEDPQNPLIVISMMELAISAGTEDSAWLQKLVEMTANLKNDSPVHTVMLYYRGIAMKQLGLFDAAQTALTSAMRLRKDRSDKLILAIMKERAEVYELQGKAKSAINMWEKIFADDPTDEDALRHLNLNNN